jgi:hypothetical protein
MHYLLIYDTAPAYLTRRGEFRQAHLDLAWAAHDRGELVMGGAVGDPVDSAILLFHGNSPAAAEAFARADPYVQNGLVKQWVVKPWTTVAGDLATYPIRKVPA